MLRLILLPLAWLPLAWIHALGGFFGRMGFRRGGKFARRIRDNLAISGLTGENAEAMALRVAEETGKAGLEAIAIWLRPIATVQAWTRPDEHWTSVEAQFREGRGLILLVPHLGSWEICGQFFSHQFPMTTMYREPKLTALDPLMRAGRERDGCKLVGADVRGVRALLRALKKGEAVGLLPDQAPSRGEGIWVEFFGRLAYTMTLAIKLRQSTGCAIALGYAERLPRGQGFIVRMKPLENALEGSLADAARNMNAAIEEAIREKPEQYLWSYNRYKVPAGVTPPPSR
jgi:KDO2-lipid IV(A) lauroyltransferase